MNLKVDIINLKIDRLLDGKKLRKLLHFRPKTFKMMQLPASTLIVWLLIELRWSTMSSEAFFLASKVHWLLAKCFLFCANFWVANFFLLEVASKMENLGKQFLIYWNLFYVSCYAYASNIWNVTICNQS